MDVKVINQCKLNSKVISGTAAMTIMYKYPDIYTEAKEKNCNVVIKPICTDMKTGEVIARRFILETAAEY